MNGVIDVRLVAELDERDQVAVLALRAQLHEALGGGHRREERRVGRARLLSVAALNGVRMLIDASIIRPMRRPGNGHSRLTSAVNGIGERQEEERQAGQEQQQRDVDNDRESRPGDRFSSAGSTTSGGRRGA